MAREGEVRVMVGPACSCPVLSHRYIVRDDGGIVELGQATGMVNPLDDADRFFSNPEYRQFVLACPNCSETLLVVTRLD